MRWREKSLSGGRVDVGNLQVVIWQDKFYSKKFCVTCSESWDFNRGGVISYKGDNSTLAPTFPVLYVENLGTHCREWPAGKTSAEVQNQCLPNPTANHMTS